MDIGIIDDDWQDCLWLKQCIQAFQAQTPDAPLFQVVTFASSEELLWYQGNLDLLFMDIELGSVKGTALATQIRCKQQRPLMIVFVSAYPDYVSQTYQAEAFGFLLKPVEEGRFFAQMQRCLARFAALQGTFVRFSHGKPITLAVKEVVYLEVHKRIIQAILQNGSCVEYYGKISEECRALRDKHFVQCHRGLVVNLAYIKGFGANKEIVLDFDPQGTGNPKRLPVSIPYRALVEKAFLHYVAHYQ